MNAPIKLQKEPEISNPRLVVGWADAGSVGATVVGYLRDKLGAEEFCQIEPYDFQLMPQILVRDAVIETVEYPRNKFYSWRSKLFENDLILFKGEEPSIKPYEFANLILDVAQRFGVKRMYSVGGMYSSVVHTEKPRILAVANKPELKGYLRDYDVDSGINYYGPTTVSGLLLGVAKMRGIEGIGLTGEIPFYLARLPYPMSKYPRSCQAMLKVLAEMLNLEIDLSDFDGIVKRTEQEMGTVYGELYEEARKEMGGLIYPSAEAAAESGNGIPDLARQRIEQLFEQAERDKSKTVELQRELYRLGLFQEYQDRFFSLFRQKGSQE